jgi:hypothetical protein
MNERFRQNCDRFEAMIVEWFEANGLPAADKTELTAHLATCASCRESFELSARMEMALVARRTDIPAVDAFLPAFSPAHETAAARNAHSRLVDVFRTLMSPAGVSIMLVLWASMLALRFRNEIAEVFVWTSSDRFSALSHDVSNLLLSVSGDNVYTLSVMYLALAVLVLGSTSLIAVRFIRHH